jgi:hypothetical protein
MLTILKANQLLALFVPGELSRLATLCHKIFYSPQSIGFIDKFFIISQDEAI